VLHAIPILVSLFVQAVPGAAASQGKDRAQALLKEGSALYKQADFATALKKFEEAYALYPSPKLQSNIAQADRELGKTVEAVEAFETFLVQAPDAAPEIVAEARQSLAELKPKLAQIRVDAIGGANVMVDDRSLGVTPIARIIWVLPGRHSVTVKHPSYLPVSLQVTVSVGEIRTLSPKLFRAGEPPSVAAPPAAVPAAPAAVVPAATPADIVANSPPPPPAPDRGSSAPKSWYFWTAAGATALFTGGAVVAGLSANGKYKDLENGCGMTSARCSDSQIDEVKSRATLANVLWILAGASAVATGLTFYMDRHEAGVSMALRF